MSAVNRRQAEVVVNNPRKLAELESQVRKAVTARVSRGRVNVLLAVEPIAVSHGVLEVDERLVTQYRDALEGLSKELGMELELAAADLIRAPGVFSVTEVSLEVETAWPLIERALERALAALTEMQDREGAHLAEDIRETLSLLKEYEDMQRLTSDPRDRRRAATQIERLKTDLARYRAEYRELGCA